MEMASFFQTAMQQLTHLLSEDLRKEIYDLWEVSLHSFNPMLKFQGDPFPSSHLPVKLGHLLF